MNDDKNSTKIDHTEHIFHKAIGFTDDEMQEIISQSKRIVEKIECDKKSVIVEEILNIIGDMSYKEISVIIFILLEYMRHNVGSKLFDVIAKVMEHQPPPPELPTSDNDPSYL